jgi:hypothetical protein
MLMPNVNNALGLELKLILRKRPHRWQSIVVLMPQGHKSLFKMQV